MMLAGSDLCLFLSMSERVHPPSPTALPILETVSGPAPPDNHVPPIDAGPSNHVDVGAVCAPPLSMTSSSGPSPSSSQQPSPSPSGVKYENTRELKQLRDKIEAFGNKEKFAEQSDLLRNSENILVKYSQLMEELLINLDPKHSTMAIVYVLAVMFEGASGKKMEREMMKAAEILKTFVESKVLVRDQLLHVVDVYTILFRKVTKFLIHKNEMVNGVPFLKAGINVIVDEGDQTVTTLHGCLFTLCLKAQLIDEGLLYLYPYIKGILPEHNPSSGAPSTSDSRSLLTYLYYGALLAARAQQWQRSTSLLKAACVIPGYAVSEIQIEALKKLHIISYIACGSISMPNRSPCLSKAFKQQGSVYAHMAAELEGGTLSEWDDDIRTYGRHDNEPLSTAQIANRANIVKKYLNSNLKAMEKDQNVELLVILQHEFKLRTVLKIAEMYKVASIARITEMAKLESTEETNELLAVLQKDNRLIVVDEGEGFVSLTLPPTIHKLPDITAAQKRLEAINEDVKRLDLHAKKTPWYIQRTNKTGHPNDDEGLSMSNIPENFAAPLAPTSVPS